MQRIERFFADLPVLLPVIHVVSPGQGLRNARVAQENSADGIFLISHGYLKYRELIELSRLVKAELPDLWVGANFLDLGPDPVLAMEKALTTDLDGLWTDNSRVVEGESTQTIPQQVLDQLRASGSDMLYFSGASFKYVYPQSNNDATAAALAERYMDVVLTSGPGTGRPASPGKTRAMKAAMHSGKPLGLASGVTVENAATYDGVDIFLVATGLLLEGGDDFDPDKVRHLADVIHSLRSAD